MGNPPELTDEQWNLVAGIFDPPNRRGAPARTDRRQMVDAMLYLARTGVQWRFLPDRFGPWGAVWQQWRRWRDSGVWPAAMLVLAKHARAEHGDTQTPSAVVIDAQTVKGGRAGKTFHEAGGRGGRIVGAKRTILIDKRGLPFAARVDSARHHDVVAGRLLVADALPALPTVKTVLADKGYRALDKAAAKHGAKVEVRANPPGTVGFKPLAMVWRVENAFAQLGRFRRLARCFEGSRESAEAWLQVACVGYLLTRA